MTFYPIPSNGPYRSSTGSMPLRVPHSSSPNRTRHDEKCEECGSSYHDEHLLHMNTPFSGTPNQSAASLHPSNSSHRRRPSNAGHEPPPATLTRYHNGALVMEPATSYPAPGGERRRRASISAASASASVPRSHARKSWSSYAHEIEIVEDAHRRGTTRLPRKYVNKEAVKQFQLQYDEDKHGALIVHRPLSRSEIEYLVELTESIRAHRHHSHSSSRKEKHVRIITEPTGEVPHPEDSHHHHRGPTYAHGSPPTPSTGHYYVTSSNPRTSSHRLSRAEEEAAAAEAKARHKEYRAETSGSYSDSRKAAKARAEAEEKARQLEELARKERRREVVVVR